ncbi:MAG: ABC transporter permease [Lachnospiraceae bacterium]|nr:ABC transporter permease [Lachnospiraceae bacterium]
MVEKVQKYQFLFSELVKRDFKQKYKRTSLGMVWSILAPLLNLFVLDMVFSAFFRREQEYFTIYLFSGVLIFNFFSESTKGGMASLMANAKIFTKVNVPKYLFLFSKNVSALINFGLTLVLYFIFCLIYKIPFGPHMLTLIFPVICVTLFNVGMGMVLSALFVFFRDVQYLYDVFLTLLRYMSAIFYTVTRFPLQMQRLLLLNPIYAYIKYFRMVVIEQTIPSFEYHVMCLFYALAMLGLGFWFYKKYNHQFLYYV